MRIQKKTQVLALMLALLMLLSACGGNTQPPASSTTEPNTPADTTVPPVSTPVEESADVTATEKTPDFYTVNGLSYPSELGKPILSENAAALASSASLPSAAEQITNVGDAIYYLQEVEAFDQPFDTCTLFATLLEGDYEEIGRILLTRPDNGYCLVYIKSGTQVYPFDPFMLAKGNCGWFYDPASEFISASDLDTLGQWLMETCPYNGENKPMTAWESNVLSTGALQENTPAEPIDTNPTPQPPDVSTPGIPPSLPSPPDQSSESPQSKFALREYADEELQAFVDADLSFQDACDKLSTVPDAIQYLYLRGYHFAPDDAGIEASTRYRLNSGACVGGSALLNALLEGDYDEQGYVYIFYARGEHVMPFFVLDGVYFYCDLVTVFNNGNTDITRNPVSYMTKEPETFYEAWLEIEPHDLNDSESDMYLGAMYTTGYFGDPTMPQAWLWSSEDGKHCRIELSPEEKESQQIFFMREGYTFEF